MQGYVTAIDEKHGTGRNGPWVLYNVSVDGQKYGAGFNKPACNNGDYINYETKQNGQYTNIENISVASAPPAGNSSPAGSVSNSSSSAVRVDTRDISIRYQSSRKDAIALTTMLLANDALAVPAKKAEKADAILAFTEDLSNQLYISLQEVMDNNGVSVEDLIPQPEGV